MSTLAAEEKKETVEKIRGRALWGTSLSAGLHPGAELGSATSGGQKNIGMPPGLHRGLVPAKESSNGQNLFWILYSSEIVSWISTWQK